MKKLLFVLALIAAIVAVTSCSGVENINSRSHCPTYANKGNVKKLARDRANMERKHFAQHKPF